MLGHNAKREGSSVLTLEVLDGDGRVLERVQVGEISGRFRAPQGERPTRDQGSRNQDG